MALENQWDLIGCLDANPQTFTLDDIATVLANFEGEHEGPHYYWILALTDGRFVMLTGWCDYTGWDCQSAAESAFAVSPEEAVSLIRQDDEINEYQDVLTVRASLLEQLALGRILTKHEKVGEDLFG